MKAIKGVLTKLVDMVLGKPEKEVPFSNVLIGLLGIAAIVALLVLSSTL